MPTQSLTFVGETATSVGDGYAGFRVSRTYELQVERRDDGTVAIVMDQHEHVSPAAGPLVVNWLIRHHNWLPGRTSIGLCGIEMNSGDRNSGNRNRLQSDCVELKLAANLYTYYATTFNRTV